MSITRAIKAKKLKPGMVLQLLDKHDFAINEVEAVGTTVQVRCGATDTVTMGFNNEERVLIYNET